MSDRACVRGCIRPGVHYAACPWDHVEAGSERAAELTAEGVAPCSGCAARECRDGSMICDKCFGRMRGLLRDASDMLARLQSIADPRKATPTDQPHFGSSSVEPVAPVPADVLDALAVVEFVAATFDEDTLRHVSNDRERVLQMSEYVIERHPVIDGERAAWSLQDAIDRWGVERRDRSKLAWEPDVDGELASFDVHEHGDRFVSQGDAAALVGVKRFTIARWAKKGLLSVTRMPGPRGSRRAMYRLSEVQAAWEQEGATA